MLEIDHLLGNKGHKDYLKIEIVRLYNKYSLVWLNISFLVINLCLLNLILVFSHKILYREIDNDNWTYNMTECFVWANAPCVFFSHSLCLCMTYLSKVYLSTTFLGAMWSRHRAFLSLVCLNPIFQFQKTRSYLHGLVMRLYHARVQRYLYMGHLMISTGQNHPSNLLFQCLAI